MCYVWSSGWSISQNPSLLRLGFHLPTLRAEKEGTRTRNKLIKQLEDPFWDLSTCKPALTKHSFYLPSLGHHFRKYGIWNTGMGNEKKRPPNNSESNLF